MRFKIVSTLITALIMSGAMSLVMGLVNGGFRLDVLMWLKSWGLGFVVTFPCSLFLPTWVRKVLSRLMKQTDIELIEVV